MFCFDYQKNFGSGELSNVVFAAV